VSKLVNSTSTASDRAQFNSFVLLLAVAGSGRRNRPHGMRLLSEHPEQYDIVGQGGRFLPTDREVLRFSPGHRFAAP
jgi:hypothetical protein